MNEGQQISEYTNQDYLKCSSGSAFMFVFHNPGPGFKRKNN